MRYGLIGCGRIAKHHINSVKALGVSEVVLCDIDQEKARAFAREHGIIDKTRIYQDYLEMIKKETLDFVSIATESGKHARIAMDVITSGVNVIIEKPMALSIEDAKRIIELKDRYGVFVEVCHQNRYNSSVQALKTAIDEGRFGKITHGSLHVRWHRNEQYYACGLWRGTWEQDGGALMNQCIHGIDLLIWLMGSPVQSVYGTVRNFNHSYIEAEDFGMAILQFENGSVATIEGTTDTYINAEEACLCVYGLNGAVKLGGATYNNIEKWTFSDKRGEDEKIILNKYVSSVYGNSHPLVFKNMIDALQSKNKISINAIDGMRALETVLAIYKSAKERKVVTMPIGDFSTMDMMGVNMNV